MEVREEKLVAHQISIEELLDKLDSEMKQFQNIQNSGVEMNMKEMQLESIVELLQSARKCISDVLESCSCRNKRKQQAEIEFRKRHRISVSQGEVSNPVPVGESEATYIYGGGGVASSGSQGPSTNFLFQTQSSSMTNVGVIAKNNNWRTTQGGETPMETGDWRTQLRSDARQRIVNKITEVLRRRIPFGGQEGLQELKKIAAKFEEKIYTIAKSQTDYLRKISLKMLVMENKSNPMQSNYAVNSMNSLDPALQGMQSEVSDAGAPEDDEDDAELSDNTLLALEYHEKVDHRKTRK